MKKLHIQNSCTFSYQLFYFLSYFCQNCCNEFQPQGAYNLGSFMRVSTAYVYTCPFFLNSHVLFLNSRRLSQRPSKEELEQRNILKGIYYDQMMFTMTSFWCLLVFRFGRSSSAIIRQWMKLCPALKAFIMPNTMSETALINLNVFSRIYCCSINRINTIVWVVNKAKYWLTVSDLFLNRIKLFVACLMDLRLFIIPSLQ